MQETHARLFREHQAGKVFETPSHLFRVARNAAIDVFRRNRAIAIDGLGEVAALGVLEEKPDAAESASQTQELELLREAIALLPVQCQEIFSLHRCQGLTQRQVAEKLGISQNLVHTQLCHAIFRCRQYLASRGITRGRLQEMSELSTGRINADATRAG
jgi:RNA polymerase sigma-70 factor (ECF subfamily)